VRGCRQDKSSSIYKHDAVSGYCEHNDEPSDSILAENYLSNELFYVSFKQQVHTRRIKVTCFDIKCMPSSDYFFVTVEEKFKY
jgi:hypothetical protein